jgi:membrane protein required for colicin V production
VTVYGIALFDLVFFVLVTGGFLLGFVQGIIRRLLGIASIMVSFFLAANLREPLGDLLAREWTQYPPGYGVMLVFGGTFVVLTVLSTILIQGFYERAPVVQDSEWIDEVLGGLLGVVQALLLVGIAILILGSYFGLPTTTYDPDEFMFLRNAWDAISRSAVGVFYIDTLIPIFLGLSGGLVPASLRQLFAG